MVCSVCGKEVTAGKTCTCGYDLTQSYLNYRTLCPVPQEQRRLDLIKISAFREIIRHNTELRNQLQKCIEKTPDSKSKANSCYVQSSAVFMPVNLIIPFKNTEEKNEMSYLWK